MRRLVHLAMIASAASAACGGRTEVPRYRFDAGDVRRYALTLEAWPHGRTGGETVTATAEVVETVESVGADGTATIRVEVGPADTPTPEAPFAPFALPAAPRAFRVQVRTGGEVSGVGDAAIPFWLLPTLPPDGRREWDHKTTFGRVGDVVWHHAARHEITGTVGPSTVIRTTAVLVGDRHPPGTYVLHEPGAGCPSCEIVADGRGLGTSLVDLRGGAIREARHEWVVREGDPGPGRVGRVVGWRIALVRLD